MRILHTSAAAKIGSNTHAVLYWSLSGIPHLGPHLSINCPRIRMIHSMMSWMLIAWTGCQTVLLMRPALTEIDTQPGTEVPTRV